MLFYTDGATEARNKAGQMFSLTDSEAVRMPHRPEQLVDQLCAELVKYVGHAPDDDIALLLLYQDTPLPEYRDARLLTAQKSSGTLSLFIM